MWDPAKLFCSHNKRVYENYPSMLGVSNHHILQSGIDLDMNSGLLETWFVSRNPTYTRKMFGKKRPAKRTRQHARIILFDQIFFTEGRLPPKVVLYQRSSSTKGRLPPKIVFHLRSSSTQVCLSPKVVFHQRLSSTKGCLPPKVVFHWM